jgi:hypothetical protein
MSAKIVPVAGGGTKELPCMARVRKIAISERFTRSPGQ